MRGKKSWLLGLLGLVIVLMVYGIYDATATAANLTLQWGHLSEMYGRRDIVKQLDVPDIRPIEGLEIPFERHAFALLQNYPNPFNPETWIPYQLIEDVDVTIRIYDVFGQPIKILDLGYKQAGPYTSKDKAAYWDGRNEVGELVSSGVYFYQFYQIRAENFVTIRKMVIKK